MSEQKKEFEDLDAVKIIVTALEKFTDEERRKIIKWSCEKLDMDYSLERVEKMTAKSPFNPQTLETPRLQTNNDIKSFVNLKNPKNDSQFAAVVAYYYKFEAPDEEKKDSISSEDLVEATRLANRTRLHKPAGTLHNAYSQAGLLNQSEHGKYKLNSVGENLVAMVLPGENEGNATKSTTKRRKNTKKKKIKK